ncbi:MAG: hypothetical protein EOP07_19045 [Proteobacteria bacterium]|nr:MAG: hypothetical protein EOP07_19045 [Pseudomonadota bacterium]
MSIILYTALQTMQPCEKVFADTAKATNPTFKVEEQAQLEEFAKAACATSNPDILWLLAYQETNFRFVIVRENHPTDFKITRGAEAIKVLKELKRKTLAKIPTSLNVDIGVMQFNWRGLLNGEELTSLPPVIPQDIYQIFANTRKFPKPVKKTYDPALPDIASK